MEFWAPAVGERGWQFVLGVTWSRSLSADWAHLLVDESTSVVLSFRTLWGMCFRRAASKAHLMLPWTKIFVKSWKKLWLRTVFNPLNTFWTRYWASPLYRTNNAFLWVGVDICCLLHCSWLFIRLKIELTDRAAVLGLAKWKRRRVGWWSRVWKIYHLRGSLKGTAICL